MLVRLRLQVGEVSILGGGMPNTGPFTEDAVTEPLSTIT